MYGRGMEKGKQWIEKEESQTIEGKINKQERKYSHSFTHTHTHTYYQFIYV